MKFNSVKVCASAALIAAAFGLSAPALAAGGTVSYVCQNNRTVNVQYQFNAQGIPTTAQAVLNGSKRVLRYDLDRSDNVDTFFKDRAGYNLGSNYMDSSNYRNSNIMITAPNNQILFKDCSPRGKHAHQEPERAGGHADGSVAYVCQNNRRLNVRYRFNEVGLPTHATANIRGRAYTLRYDQNESDNVDTIFAGQGYRLSAGYLDSKNFRTEGGLMVTAPNNQLLYKDCSPVQ